MTSFRVSCRLMTGTTFLMLTIALAAVTEDCPRCDRRIGQSRLALATTLNCMTVSVVPFTTLAPPGKGVRAELFSINVGPHCRAR